MKKLLMGNEAAALAALNAGVNLICGYPGTPSSEVIETAAKYNDGSTYIEWSVNEKAALEIAAGAAYAGARTMVTMKQVGLNAAADPAMCLSYIGVKGGMVIYVADDPGPISSQTEQDTRRFGGYSKMTVFDPSTPEELYRMIGSAFALSEQIGKPVIVRPTTRICHACASIELPERLPPHPIDGFRKSSDWVIFPGLSRRRHTELEALQPKLSELFSSSEYNTVTCRGTTDTAIIASGVSHSYALEAEETAGTGVTLIKLGCAVPLPDAFLLHELAGIRRVIVAEELDPVIEDALYAFRSKYGLSFDILGKRTQTFPFAGEYSVELIEAVLRSCFSIPPREAMPPIPMPVRPPVLCAGCPHRASFYAVKYAMEKKAKREATYSGDIGCYTLGNAAPLNMVDTCLCMGAGITIAQGLYHAQPDVVHFAFIGDSTFFHSGITGLINAVYNRASIVVIILDNSTTAMTGHQPHPGTGKTMMHTQTPPISLEAIVKASGVTFMEVVNPLDFQTMVDACLRASVYPGVSVIIARSPCIALVKSDKHCTVDSSKCIGCERCLREIGCPALAKDQTKVGIDPNTCTGCGLCREICPKEAIRYESK